MAFLENPHVPSGLSYKMEELTGNLSVNYSREVTALLVTAKNLISVGILMIIENFISIIILWRCTRLLFQIRILSLNLAMSDLLTVFFLALTNMLLYEKKSLRS